jgi:hypothetical protein
MNLEEDRDPLTIYQYKPVRMPKSELEKLEYRDDVKGEKYQEGVPYRTREGYPNCVFFWHPLPKGSDAKGEWRMAPLASGE